MAKKLYPRTWIPPEATGRGRYSRQLVRVIVSLDGTISIR